MTSAIRKPGILVKNDLNDPASPLNTFPNLPEEDSILPPKSINESARSAFSLSIFEIVPL